MKLVLGYHTIGFMEICEFFRIEDVKLDSNHHRLVELEALLTRGEITFEDFNRELSPVTVVKTVITAVEEMIEYWVVVLFTLKDLCIGSYGPEARKSYRVALAENDFIRFTEKWIHTYPIVRSDSVVYVLGKLSDRRNLPLVVSAFYHWLERDPRLFRRIFFELGWLGDKNLRPKIQKLLGHQDYLFRWELLAIQFHSSPLARAQRFLCQDPHPYVRRDAVNLYYLKNENTLIDDIQFSALNQNIGEEYCNWKEFVENYLKTKIKPLNSSVQIQDSLKKKRNYYRSTTRKERK